MMSLGTKELRAAESGSTASTPATRVAHHGNAKLLGYSTHANQDYDLTTSNMQGCMLLLPLRDALLVVSGDH